MPINGSAESRLVTWFNFVLDTPFFFVRISILYSLFFYIVTPCMLWYPAAASATYLLTLRPC